MKYKFNEIQLNNFLMISDLALKASGYKSLEKILHIVNILKYSVNDVCEFTDIDIPIIELIFDGAIKRHGFEVADAILELTTIIRNPIQEEIASVVDDGAIPANNTEDVKEESKNKE